MMRYYTSTRMVKIKNTGLYNIHKDVEELDLSFIAGGNAEW